LHQIFNKYNFINIKKALTEKLIYLIRHVQTDYNKQGIVQGGGIDSDLNEMGRQQAKAFYDVYNSIHFDKIYTSALKRTHQSVQQFLEKNIPWEILPGLNEINWGTREGQKITPQEDAYYHWVLQQWRDGNDNLRIEGGESPIDVQKRQLVELKKIISHEDEKIILICMHGRAMRILLCTILNRPLKEMDSFEHENLCLYKLSYKNDAFKSDLLNNVQHLEHLLNASLK